MLHRIYQPQQCQRNEEREKRFLRKKQNPNKHQQTADKLSPTRQSYDGRQGQRKRRHVQGVHLKQPIYRRRMKMQALRTPRTKDDKAWGNLSSRSALRSLKRRAQFPLFNQEFQKMRTSRTGSGKGSLFPEIGTMHPRQRNLSRKVLMSSPTQNQFLELPKLFSAGRA